jgi:hypothetical protein
MELMTLIGTLDLEVWRGQSGPLCVLDHCASVRRVAFAPISGNFDRINP